MTIKLRLTIVAALLGAMSFVAGSPAHAASDAANRRAFLKVLAIGEPVPLPNPPPNLTPQQIQTIDRNVARFGVSRPPAIPLVVRNASSTAKANRRSTVLERYRRQSLRQGGRAFGGVFPTGATVYIPTQPINIVSYFPVFRI